VHHIDRTKQRFCHQKKDEYDGHWLDGRMHGQGTYRYTEGDVLRNRKSSKISQKSMIINSKSTLRYLRHTKLLLTKAPDSKTCTRNNDLDLQTNMARGTCLRSYSNFENFCQNRLEAFRGVFRILKRLVKKHSARGLTILTEVFQIVIRA
jgi:hypothetical protein